MMCSSRDASAWCSSLSGTSSYVLAVMHGCIYRTPCEWLLYEVWGDDACNTQGGVCMRLASLLLDGVMRTMRQFKRTSLNG
jgi:hypothetical protein